MKIGELFIELGITGDAKPLKEALSGMKASAIQAKLLKQYLKDLKNATTAEEKATIKRNFANKIVTLRVVENTKATIGFIKVLGAQIAKIGVAITVIDRMANAMARANQKAVTFQRTTGLSFQTLNKYASASALVNYNATLEGTADSLQNVAQNLLAIKLGQGDISGFQMLGIMGGKSFNPLGMSVEEVIENTREGLKGITDDLVATKIITSIGFAPEDLMMLRMTSEEFAKVKDEFFLTGEERERMNQYSLELKKIHMGFSLIGERIMLEVLPAFNKLMGGLLGIAKWATDLSNLGELLLLGAIGVRTAGPLAVKGGKLATQGLLTAVGLGAGVGLSGKATQKVGKKAAGKVAQKAGTGAIAKGATNVATKGTPWGWIITALMGVGELLLNDYNTAKKGGNSLLDWSQPHQKAFFEGIGSIKRIDPIKTQPMGTNNITQNNEINVNTSETESAVVASATRLTNQLKSVFRQNQHGLE